MKKLGFGLMRLPLIDPENHSSVDMPQFCKMVDLFLKRGFTYFDTAYMYHDGVSESVAKEALVDRHARDSFTLTTKLPTFFSTFSILSKVSFTNSSTLTSLFKIFSLISEAVNLYKFFI